MVATMTEECGEVVRVMNHLYNDEMDSKVYLDNDYGFHFVIEGVKIGIYPYFMKDTLYQRSYDSINKIGKTKKLNIGLNSYINCNLQYKTMSLEVILKSKLIAYRDNDKLDIDVICSHGFDNKLYSKIIIQDI